MFVPNIITLCAVTTELHTKNECLANCEGVSYYDGTCAIDGAGVIKFSGDSLCGFLISTLSQDFKPDTLPPEFKEDGLFVSFNYRKLNQYHICDEPYANYQVIQVLEIKPWGQK